MLARWARLSRARPWLFQACLPVPPAVVLPGSVGAAGHARWAGAGPGFHAHDLAVMFLGYLAIVAQLLVERAGLLGAGAWVGSVGILFHRRRMGLIIPAMFVRAFQGPHRPQQWVRRQRQAQPGIMLAALVLRVPPQLCRRLTGAGCICRRGVVPGFASSACGCAAPIAPRIDGRNIEPAA